MQVRCGIGDLPVDRQQQAHRQLGNGHGVSARHIANVDAELGSPVAVDRVGSRTCSQHHAEPVGGLEHLALDFGAAHDQDFDALDVVGEIVSGQLGLDDAHVARSFEPAQTAGIDLVGKQNAHRRHR